jgi:hypothetical protein
MEADNEEEEVSNSSPCTDNDGEPLWLFRKLILLANLLTYATKAKAAKREVRV